MNNKRRNKLIITCASYTYGANANVLGGLEFLQKEKLEQTTNRNLCLNQRNDEHGHESEREAEKIEEGEGGEDNFGGEGISHGRVNGKGGHRDKDGGGNQEESNVRTEK